MLPAGFEWRPYLDGPALYLGDRLVAMACPARDEARAPWRVALNPRHVGMRYEFLADEVSARRYVEAWSRKWEAELRERYR